VLSKPSADSIAVGRRQKAAFKLSEYFLGKPQSLHDAMSDGEDPLRWTRTRAEKLNIPGQGQGFAFKTVSGKTVEKSIRKAKHSSALDMDGLLAEILKMCGSAVVEPLTWLINESIRSGTVPPACWKQARVVPGFKKKGSKHDKKNYRPISLQRGQRYSRMWSGCSWRST
jgi:hypothetical protein